VKYYAWETLIQKLIEDVRKSEIGLIFQSFNIRAYMDTIFSTTPMFVAVFSFWIYASIYGWEDLTVGRVYAVIAYYNMFLVPLRLMVLGLTQYQFAKHAFFRLDHFSRITEIKEEGY
jgi:ABC-type multidrug transport system fused ATPase/permease subunit